MMESLGLRLGWGKHKYTAGDSMGRYNHGDKEEEEEEEQPTANLDKEYRKLSINDHGGYQDSLLSDRSPSSIGGGRENDSGQGFGGFQNEDKSLQRKDSDDWGSGWSEGGWSESPKPLNARFEKSKSSPSAKKTKSKKKEGDKKESKEELLIDFGDGGDKTKKKDDGGGWGNWEEDAWESLSKND